MYAGGDCFFESLTKSRVSFAVGCEEADALHLNRKYYSCAVALGCGFAKLLNMPYSSFGGSVGEHSRAVFFKGYSLDLDKSSFAVFVLCIEIKTRAAV